jgi:hypothetical protein
VSVRAVTRVTARLPPASDGVPRARSPG